MIKLLAFLSLLIAPLTPFSIGETAESTGPFNVCRELYNEMNLQPLISYEAFREAFTGYQRINGRKKEILTLIDFTKPSKENRLFVLDMKKKQVLFASLVAHGQGSGEMYATAFSNRNGSHQSSLGFFLTGSTYNGRNGYSLQLDGLEQAINDKARERAIVIHGAAYADPAVVASGNRLGRSFGCPAVPRALATPIIDAIKEGSVLYIYAGDDHYLTTSPILSGDRSV